MKIRNLFFLATAVGFSLSAVAQPSLNEGNFAPTIGGNVNYYMVSNYTGDEGPAGASQNWDFSNVTNDTIFQVGYISCAASPDCSGNPGTTLVMTESNGAYIYYIVDNNKMSIKGLEIQAQGQNVAFHYSDPEDYMQFPFTFNDSYSDNFKCTASITGVNILRSGISTVSADAYGTLKTPIGTYQNAIRIYTHQVYSDTMSIGGNNQIMNYDTKIYSWYQPDIHEILMSISSISINGAAPSVTLQYSDATSTTSIQNLTKGNANFEVYPNPATDYATIKLTQGNNAIQNIDVVNILGQRVATYLGNSLSQNQNGVYSIDLKAIPSGIYWLQVQIKQGQFSQKLQVIK